jgi:hypothetical protein
MAEAVTFRLDPDSNAHEAQVCPEDLELFAELIVGECLAHGKLTQSQAVVNGSEEYNAGREMGIEVFMNQIKKHFGVEE